jgi:hypothetical protein
MSKSLCGKTREQIEHELRDKSRAELIEIIWSLSTVEELFTPAELASREKRSRREVLRDLKAGKYGGGFYAFAFNSLRASASGINAYRKSFFVPVAAEPGPTK